jgi:hypothetical protein
VVSVADERVVVWDVGECADGEVCAGGGGLAFGVFIFNGTISKRNVLRRQYLDLLRLRSNVDVPRHRVELEFYIFIINGTVSKCGG